MRSKKQIMNILEFIYKFPDEGVCRLKIIEQREQIGVICHKCNFKKHFWLENKQCYECKHCHARQSLRSGTVMQNSKLPFDIGLSPCIYSQVLRSFSQQKNYVVN